MSRAAAALLSELLSQPRECEWLEFKQNKADPEEIGEYLSALANGAALHGRPAGYILWGVQDGSREVVGTSFRPTTALVNGEELEHWLLRQLTPRPHLRIHELDVDGLHSVIFEIPAACHTPVRFRDTEFIRVGSYKKRLRDYPEKERVLWANLTRQPFEVRAAASDVSAEEVLSLLDYRSYFELIGHSAPESLAAIVDRLRSERIVDAAPSGRFSISQLGAILFANDLRRFGLERRAVRVVVYDGKNRVQTIREQSRRIGYASGFQGVISFINAQLPENELIEAALRRQVRMYPEVAVRELVANALVHQDFNVGGAGPMVEIFEDRIEFTNPGLPLVSPSRFIGHPPISRNDALASLMRRLNICEERGSGITKVVAAVELFQLPAPNFASFEHHTRVVLYAPQRFAHMDPSDRIRACYQHACLRFVSNDYLTNESLRRRFGIADENYSIASRVIRDALDAGQIKRHDPTSTSKKHAKYVPFWA